MREVGGGERERERERELEREREYACMHRDESIYSIDIDICTYKSRCA